MTVFDARSDYQAARDVRDHRPILDLLGSLPQKGVLWPVVGARRAGKTWTLRALERLARDRPPRPPTYLDLRRARTALPRPAPGSCLLLDEPQLSPEGTAGRDAAELLRWCQKLHADGTTIVLAMSPAEWVALAKAGEPSSLVSAQDLRFLQPLTPAQAEALARTKEAKELLPRLPALWQRSPFLLELVFETAEVDPGLAADVWSLLKTARDRSEDAELFYFQAVFENGLTDTQRAALREVARGDSRTKVADVELLRRCGLLEKKGNRHVLGDPLLEANLSPLRIHHVSDIHFGPKSSERVDIKEKGPHAAALASGLGQPRVCDHYLQHVAELASLGTAPHLLVVSGDIAEWATDEQYADARTWLAGLREHLAPHPRLPPDAPHTLLVGGNHDVDWRETAGPAGARNRHLPFARAFEAQPRVARSRLEEPPATRDLSVVRYPDLGVELVLLGSSEFGGEVETDPVREELLALIGRLRKDAMDEPDAEKAAALRAQVSRIDPGLVHEADLGRLRRTAWDHPIRIAVLHHPVSPVPATELARFAGLINAGEVKDTLIHKGFCLVLHGHVHTGWFGKEAWPERHDDRTLRIAAAASLGSREVQEHNGYNEIVIEREGMGRELDHRITITRVVREGGTWAPKATMGPFSPST